MKIQFQSASFSRIPRITTCVTHRRGLAGVDNAIIWGVLGYQTVPEKEKKWSAVFGYLSELAWKGPM